MPLLDTHTHRTDATDAVINYDPTVDTYEPDRSLRYSVGVHPWRAHLADDTILRRTADLAAEPFVVAIGETGLDTLRGPEEEIQSHLFEWHIRLAESLHKPLIIHAVRAWQQLIKMSRPYHPFVAPWIIHGFRGKPQLAHQLLDAGFSLSFGRHYNPESFAATPVDRRYAESDEATLPTDLPGEVSTIS
ncbi:MAG: TatD family hydrolase [Barnesiella sp.]|nr:TatD family hydrolase [Barnesiella sp.]MBD5344908.1 TatD family hydrolase [Bacteroides sp.]